eukprot:TRINITY_DN8267_c0_g2_i1.p1 TRINITY_DN8267_c0_g2~~TRINITY_DN8267_c0_g2_i1.p1  ORF type:complete len:191 (+),score=2.72 TRINITY_DN8267_c0_g2_i1:337-909(+)
MARDGWQEEQGSAGCRQPERSILCVNNCGFFGSATTMNMCSKCYRDHVLKTSQEAAVASSSSAASSSGKSKGAGPMDITQTPVLGAARPVASVSEAAASAVSASSAAAASAVAAAPPLQSASSQHPAPNRCVVCKKRVGLTGFKCRCEGLFCSVHRYSDKHECSFDYKTAGREAIAKANAVIKADKIERF